MNDQFRFAQFFRAAPVTMVITMGAATADAQVQTLQEVVVTGHHEGYVTSSANTAMKTDTSLMKTPMTVEVIPHQILKEQGVSGSGLTDVLTYLGVQTLGMKDQGDYMTFRGFMSSTTLWNGFRIEDATPGINYATGGVWMDNVDRLEVLKGPSSILYGRTEPGGVVNVLTKKPEVNFHGEVHAGVGSSSNHWGGVDLTGPLSEDRDLLYRLNVAMEQSDSWYRYGSKSRSVGVAPALEWRISPQTKLSFEGMFRHFEGGSNAQQYIPIDPATGRSISVDPRDTMLPGNVSRFEQSRVFVALEHALDANWSASWKLMHNEAKNPYYRNNLAAGGSAFPLGPGQTGLYVFEGRNFQTTDAAMFDVTGHAEGFGIKHTILLGTDFYHKRFDQRSGMDFSQTTDYLNPGLPDSIPQTDDWNLRNREYALYVQDQMEFSGGWHVLLGGRYQKITEKSTTSWGGASLYETSVVQPRFGLLWQPRPWLSAYYSYAENVGSSNGIDSTGASIKPELSKQHELGVKSEWLDGRLTATLALFNLTKYNVASADLANPGFNIGVGKVESTGYEFNIQGAITGNWDVLANYSHARPHVVVGASGAAALQPQTIVAGQDLPYVSNETFSLWTSYKISESTWSGWKMGGGVNWSSAPNPIEGATIRPKSYTVVSAFMSYETRLGGHKTSLQLNVNNLLDKKYMLYQSDDVAMGGNTLAGNWGAPRQIRLGLRSEF